MLRNDRQTVEQADSSNGRTPAPDATAHESLIDKHSSLNGHYHSTHNLRIEGTVDGEIECQSTLTIAEEATVKAKVVAQNVTVGGSLDGEVTCPGRFQILPSGRVVGKVVAGTLEILAGAFYQGELSMHAQANQPQSVETKRAADLTAAVSSTLLNPVTAPSLVTRHSPDGGRLPYGEETARP